jgi:hypothetical protein
LQEAGYLTRPNPSLSTYRIDTDFLKDASENCDITMEELTEIAEKFNQNFEIIDDEPNATC